jgi:O-antigen/teichoic acid export membrane protein
MKDPESSSDRPEQESLALPAFHALKWRYAGAVFQAALQFVVGITLARLLTPEAFGVVGMALIAIGFARLVGDLGFGAAIIQYPALTSRHARAAFSGSFLAGAILFLLLWALSPWLARLFNHDELTPMLRVIGLSLVFSGMSTVSVALLRRELKFRLLTIIEIVSYAVGFGMVGVSMAIFGYGAWSLIAANIVQPFCLVALAVPIGKQSIRPSFGISEYRDLCRMATAEMLNNVVNFAAENLHFFAVGKWLGAAALGLFSRAFYLMHLPVMHFSVALWSVTFPFYAKIQSDIPRLGKVFLHTVSLTALATMPVFFALAAVPDIVIGGLFGEQWKPAARTFQILCLCGPFMAMMRVFGAITHARGYVFSECGRQVVYLIVVGLALGAGLPYGLEGVAIAVSLAGVARYLLLAHLSLELTNVKWRAFLAVQLPGVVLGIAVALPVFIASTVGRNLVEADVFLLALAIAVAAASLTLSLLYFPASWFGVVYSWMIDRFGGNLPPWLHQLATAKLRATESSAVNTSLEAKT